jgi:CheY-like chemotaxis protein
MADSTEIHQVLMNLSTNAGQAMNSVQEGILEIQLKDVDVDNDFADAHQIAPGCYQKLTIKDNGPGIETEHMEKIFDPFFTTKGEGTGLGLSVVHGIVKNFKGAIDVDSVPGRGTTFNVFWPIIQIEEAQQVISEHALPKGSESVLFVDDEEILLGVTRESLIRLGYTVTAISDSTEALSIFSQKPSGFDLVITDLTMPKMTGDILARKILKTRPDIPIILCTGYSESISKERALAMGINKFIMKPVLVRELAVAIRDVLAHGGENTGQRK